MEAVPSLVTNLLTAEAEARSSEAASCPTQTGFNAFAFLAFILLTIDTLMNINNNLNNSNNNNNNNDRNNNNNNMYESMNTNTNSRRRRGAALDRAVEMMAEEEVSPWDRRLVAQLLEAGDSRGLGAVEAWLGSVLRAAPACAAVVPCLAAAEWTGARLTCPDTNLCPLFEK